MRKYQPWAILLILAYLFSSLPNPLWNMAMARMLEPAEFGVLKEIGRQRAG